MIWAFLNFLKLQRCVRETCNCLLLNESHFLDQQMYFKKSMMGDMLSFQLDSPS